MTDLPYARLGNSGLQVPRLALGTATFGAQCGEDEARTILDRADELGLSLLDTADKYPIGSSWESAGRTEAIVGRWLKGRREQFLVATKVHGPTGSRPFQRGLSRRHLTGAVEASLRRLQTDWIDLYQLHRPDPGTPIDETLATLDDLVRAGKIRHVGMCNFPAYGVAHAVGMSKAGGRGRVTAVQSRYNLLARGPEVELVDMCRDHGVGLLVYNALAGGMLTGKHRRDGTTVRGTRFDSGGVGALYRGRYWSEASFTAVEQIARLARDAGLSMPALAVAWLLSRSAVTSVILGATVAGHLDVVEEAVSVALDVDLLDALDRASSPFAPDTRGREGELAGPRLQDTSEESPLDGAAR